MILNSRNKWFSQQKSHPALNDVIKEETHLFYFPQVVAAVSYNVNKYLALKIVPNTILV